MASITVRALSTTYDPIYGAGQDAFLSDLDAVAQVILTRLRFLQGEWWADLSDGTPVFQSILNTSFGPAQQQTASMILQQRVLDTPYVTGISNVETSFNSQTRGYFWTCTVETQFGQVTLSNQPGSSAALAGN